MTGLVLALALGMPDLSARVQEALRCRPTYFHLCATKPDDLGDVESELDRVEVLRTSEEAGGVVAVVQRRGKRGARFFTYRLSSDLAVRDRVCHEPAPPEVGADVLSLDPDRLAASREDARSDRLCDPHLGQDVFPLAGGRVAAPGRYQRGVACDARPGNGGTLPGNLPAASAKVVAVRGRAFRYVRREGSLDEVRVGERVGDRERLLLARFATITLEHDGVRFVESTWDRWLHVQFRTEPRLARAWSSLRAALDEEERNIGKARRWPEGHTHEVRLAWPLALAARLYRLEDDLAVPLCSTGHPLAVESEVAPIAAATDEGYVLPIAGGMLVGRCTEDDR